MIFMKTISYKHKYSYAFVKKKDEINGKKRKKLLDKFELTRKGKKKKEKIGFNSTC